MASGLWLKALRGRCSGEAGSRGADGSEGAAGGGGGGGGGPCMPPEKAAALLVGLLFAAHKNPAIAAAQTVAYLLEGHQRARAPTDQPTASPTASGPLPSSPSRNLPCHAQASSALPYPTVPYPTYPTLTYPSSPYPTVTYRTLPHPSCCLIVRRRSHSSSRPHLPVARARSHDGFQGSL